ncbi:copper resistance protein B [Pacificispira sp.]|uniref:copper resistance protein B n=1 Tax=Pacificispira sp. TaxID=2888761 RepID=UPI003BAA67DE
MKKLILSAALIGASALHVSSASAETVFWGIQAEQLEYRLGEGPDNVLAWDFDALVGTDELKFVWRSEAEYETNAEIFESLENQARIQVPVTDFFDAVAGVRIDTPKGQDRVYGVLGLHGLAKQWFEFDADLFLAEHPAARFEVEYEGLITNQVTLTPSVELDVPLNDDTDREVGAFGPKLELGARLSYDVVDRLLSPYVGVHYERVFGETADIATSEGKDDDAIFGVVGVRVLF